MKTARKVLALVLVMVMTLMVVPMTASAGIADTAKSISSGVKYSTTLNFYGDEKDFKISVSKSGYLDLSVVSKLERADVTVYDANGNKQTCIKEDVQSGKARNQTYYSWQNGSVSCLWNDAIEEFSATLRYEVTKGTYYIRFELISGGTENDVSLTATYPTSTTTTTASKAKVQYFSISMSKGGTIQLGAVVTPANSKVTWKSSQTGVATVSANGKVTAKGKGSTLITAKSGTSSKYIKIIVK